MCVYLHLNDHKSIHSNTYRPRSITVLFQVGGSFWIFKLYGDLVAVLKGKFERDYRIQTLKRSTERGNRRYLSPLQPCIKSTHPHTLVGLRTHAPACCVSAVWAMQHCHLWIRAVGRSLFIPHHVAACVRPHAAAWTRLSSGGNSSLQTARPVAFPAQWSPGSSLDLWCKSPF